jgi:hypothetical protein
LAGRRKRAVRSLGDARSLVDHTPEMPPQRWATCEYRREFTNGPHRLFQAKPYTTCKSLLDTWAVVLGGSNRELKWRDRIIRAQKTELKASVRAR